MSFNLILKQDLNYQSKMAIDYYQTLINLGYKLQDRGDYWQTSAIHRGGDNPTALQIYKNTGVWKDYVSGGGFKPFKALVEKSDSKDFVKLDDGNLGVPNFKNSASISSEKFFENDYPSSLLPHYSFYEKKGIDISFLELLESGLSTEGSMYQRFVFPIKNKHQKIQGLAGRDLSNRSGRPKWKHMGKKTQWIYPYYNFDKTFNSIKESGEVILVESIGDMLSLFNNSIYNVLVSFGLDVSPSLSSHLMGLNLNKVIFSFNYDKDKDLNRGRIASIKNFLKLSSYFNCDDMFICLPTKNDFGDMNSKDFEDWNLKKENNLKSPQNMCKIVKKESKKLFEQGFLSKNIYKNIKHLS